MPPAAAYTLPSPLNELPEKDRRIRCFSVNEQVFSQGEQTRGVFYLVSGEVKMVRVTEDGHEILIHRAVADTLFAEASLFTETYHCDAIVSKDAYLVECSRASILRAYKSDTDFSIAIGALFAEQLQTTRKRLELLSIRNAEERVFAALVEGLLIDDVKSFAADISLSAEATYRALGKLSKVGKVRKTGYGRYEI